jgi:large subunit ribosomal protein L10
LTANEFEALNVGLLFGEFALNRAQKETFVSEFASGIESAQAFAVLSFNKLTVEQMTSFRLSLAKQNVRVKVVKNTLAKRVFDKTPFAAVGDSLTGPTLVVYGEGDAVMTAKAIAEWSGKEGFDVKVKTGGAMGQVMTDKQFTALSKLPCRNELLVSFLWALKSEPTKFLYALKDAPQRMGYVLGDLKAKKEKENKG